MKRGDLVSVCYDGKWGRRVTGEVVATDRGRRVLVKFVPWAGDSDVAVEHWFRISRRGGRYGGPRKQCGGYVPVQDSLMRRLFGFPGDWYSVYPKTIDNFDNTRSGRKWARERIRSQLGLS